MTLWPVVVTVIRVTRQLVTILLHDTRLVPGADKGHSWADGLARGGKSGPGGLLQTQRRVRRESLLHFSGIQPV